MFSRIIFNIVPLLSNHVTKKITSKIIVVAFDDQSVNAIYIGHPLSHKEPENPPSP
jgi:hypothetical protein